MAKRRKRRGLGESNEAYAFGLNSIRSGVRGLRKALDRGSCRDALPMLLGTAAEWGRYNTERRAAGRDGRTTALSETETAYADQKARFKKVCLR
jgi:hypothetical protein